MRSPARYAGYCEWQDEPSATSAKTGACALLSVDRPGLQVQSVVRGPRSVEHGGLAGSCSCRHNLYWGKTTNNKAEVAFAVHIAPGVQLMACGFSARWRLPGLKCRGPILDVDLEFFSCVWLASLTEPPRACSRPKNHKKCHSPQAPCAIRTGVVAAAAVTSNRAPLNNGLHHWQQQPQVNPSRKKNRRYSMAACAADEYHQGSSAC